MDRNSPGMNTISYTTVALRKESVDRNSPGMNTISYTTVALRKESVDRNRLIRSPIALPIVALRKESVDRNRHEHCKYIPIHASLSARRAWIEITTLTFPGFGMEVALRKESVDRNWSILH